MNVCVQYGGSTRSRRPGLELPVCRKSGDTVGEEAKTRGHLDDVEA